MEVAVDIILCALMFFMLADIICDGYLLTSIHNWINKL